jgi:hypothetical protein
MGSVSAVRISCRTRKPASMARAAVGSGGEVAEEAESDARAGLLPVPRGGDPPS